VSVVRRRSGEFGRSVGGDAERIGPNRADRTGGERRWALRIGVRIGGERGATGCESAVSVVRRGAKRRAVGPHTADPRLTPGAQAAPWIWSYGGAAGCSPGADAPRSSDHHNDVLRRRGRRMMMEPRSASHDGVCLGTTHADHVAPLRMPRGASAPGERPCDTTNLTGQQCGLSPRCQPGVGALNVRDACLRTPSHHAHHLSPPRSSAMRLWAPVRSAAFGASTLALHPTVHRQIRRTCAAPHPLNPRQVTNK
jgi:hypothetical protein